MFSNLFAASPATVVQIYGDIVFQNQSNLERHIVENEINVNEKIPLSSADTAKLETLLWYAVDFLEPTAVRIILSSRHPQKRATLETLEDALNCPASEPSDLHDARATEECKLLLMEAVLCLRLESTPSDRDLQTFLHDIRTQQQALNSKVGVARPQSAGPLQLEAWQTQLMDKEELLARLQARICSYGDLMKEHALDRMRFDATLKTARKEFGEAERVLALAHAKLKKAMVDIEQITKDEEETRAKQQGSEHQREETLAEVTALSAKVEGLKKVLASQAEKPQAQATAPPTKPSDPLECGVCCDARVSRVLQCGHTVCAACLDKIMVAKKLCHICRTPIKTVGPIYI